MNRLFFLGATLLLFTSLKANTGMQADTTGDNRLSDAEKTAGWQLLFNGETMQGWRTYQQQEGSWKVIDGMLCSASADAGNADLITEATYGDFELAIDWKLSPEGNSGILYLVTEQNSDSYLSGPEYQLIDDNGFPGNIEDWQKTGANYAMHAPQTLAAHKPGEWNTTRIIVNKGHVEHWLNGKKVVEYELGSDDWKQKKAAGKWKDAAGYAAAKTGHIALQSSHSQVETSGVCFKNIKLRKL